MRVFFLEDSPDRIRQVRAALSLPKDVNKSGGVELTLATTVAEAKLTWQPPYDVVLLDHDLEPAHYELLRDPDAPYPLTDPRTGYAFCKWLVEGKAQGADAQPSDAEIFVVHTFNYHGGRYMMTTLAGKRLPAVREMFGQPLLNALMLRLRTEREQWAV